jgi:hypothetical protein
MIDILHALMLNRNIIYERILIILKNSATERSSQITNNFSNI